MCRLPTVGYAALLWRLCMVALRVSAVEAVISALQSLARLARATECAVFIHRLIAIQHGAKVALLLLRSDLAIEVVGHDLIARFLCLADLRPGLIPCSGRGDAVRFVAHLGGYFLHEKMSFLPGSWLANTAMPPTL